MTGASDRLPGSNYEIARRLAGRAFRGVGDRIEAVGRAMAASGEVAQAIVITSQSPSARRRTRVERVGVRSLSETSRNRSSERLSLRVRKFGAKRASPSPSPWQDADAHAMKRVSKSQPAKTTRSKVKSPALGRRGFEPVRV
jgi:hypothetical protein